MTPASRRPEILRALAPLTLIAVAACGGVATDDAPTPTPAPLVAAPAVAAPEAATPAPPVAAAETATVAPAPASLAGLDEGQLAGLFGPPRFTRRDDPAQIWQYRSDSCALDVFLYKTGKDGPFTVLHVETRGRDKNPVDHKDCFRSLLKDRDEGRAG